MKLDNVLNIIAEDFEGADDQQTFARLAEYIFTHKSDLQHLTYSFIAKVAGTKKPEKILQITQYLLGERVKLLEIKFELIIENDIFQLDDETIYHAETTGNLIHPETGYPVENYDRFVYPYFVPSEELENG